MRTVLSLLLLAGCSSVAAVPRVRFRNAAPVIAVNDRRDTPKAPKQREFVRYLYAFDGQIVGPVTRALQLKRHERARGVNALDEVPDSTWFTNRIGVRDVSPDEILDPPGAVGSPEAHKPWTVVSSKVGGLTVGFIMKDARGEKFLLKFDPRGYPEAETATQIVVGRLLWAFGYNVTDDYVVSLRAEDLELAPDAVVKDLAGHTTPLTRARLEHSLLRVEKNADGSMRGLASHYLDGKPLGGHPAEGTRADDPNDRIPHELRRDLRGAYVAFSWLDHNDLHEGQMVDMYVEDPAAKARHYVKHYFIDFGIALGFATTKNKEPRFGHEYLLDVGAMVRSFVTLGLDEPGYERRRRPALRGLGHYEIETYDPGAWKAHTPAYRPIYTADRFDKLWASKILMRFRRDHIRAAVNAAKLSDPRAAEWLTDAIIARQRKTAQYWFERVAPLDELVVDGSRLCFKDLSITYAFRPARSTAYTLTAFGRDNQKLGTGRLRAADGGVTCASITLDTRDAESYTIVRIDTTRPGFHGRTFVHVAQEPHAARMRVIGIWRE